MVALGDIGKAMGERRDKIGSLATLRASRFGAARCVRLFGKNGNQAADFSD